MDLLSQMVKRKNYLLNPISRQNFANALAENHNLKLEVCHKTYDLQKEIAKKRSIENYQFSPPGISQSYHEEWVCIVD